MEQKKHRRKLQELTIKDDFLFSAVMTQKENCRRLIELVLGFPVGRVEISREHSLLYHPECKGVRLDVYARDVDETRYNIEMQVLRHEGLGERVRYYHSQIDMELLLSGHMYEDLPRVYVIFICDFDPFGKGRYKYTFEKSCREVAGLDLEDGCCSVFLSARGGKDSEAPREMVSFLKYVGSSLEESERDFGDAYVERLQASVKEIKADRQMEERYMVLERLLQEERQEGRQEGHQEGRLRSLAETVLLWLGELGEVPDSLAARIVGEQDEKTLQRMLKQAAAAKSLDEFMEGMCG